MKTEDAHPLGIAWVTLVFLSIPILFYFGDYGLENSWLRSVMVAGASGTVTFAIMAVLFWISRVRPIRFGSGFHKTRGFESRALYRALGTDSFRKVLLWSPFRSLNADVHLRGTSVDHLQALLKQTELAEASHVIAFVVMIPVTYLYATGNDPSFAYWLSAFNIVGNVYPVLLQRMTRVRVSGLLARSGSPHQAP